MNSTLLHCLFEFRKFRRLHTQKHIVNCVTEQKIGKYHLNWQSIHSCEVHHLLITRTLPDILYLIYRVICKIARFIHVVYIANTDVQPAIFIK